MAYSDFAPVHTCLPLSLIHIFKKKYAIGVDFGTLSARALLVDADTGIELASSEMEYPHGVIDKEMPSGEPLPPSWALQDPQDYLDAFYQTCLLYTSRCV